MKTTTGAVAQGQWIGTSGDSGWSSGPHLHFEVRHGCQTSGRPPNGCAVNPDDPNNDGNYNDSLWQDGEWTGSNPAGSKARRRYVTLGQYGETVIDDTTNNSGGFTRGRSGTHVCISDSDCPFWFRAGGGYNNGGFYWTKDNDSTTDYWAEWRPSLTSFAAYEVKAYMACTSDSQTEFSISPTWRAPYQIQHYDGTTTVWVDQLTLTRSSACNRWIGLGVYRGEPGTGFNVHLTDATGETGSGVQRKVVADAVNFVRVNIGGFEAENYRKKVDRGGFSWGLSTSVTGYSGNGYMIALPNNGTTIDSSIETSSPDMKFNLVFPTAGTYYVWVRGRGNSTTDDSIHAGRENQVLGTTQHLTCTQWSQAIWVWCKSRAGGSTASIQVTSPGRVTFNLYMRDDGFRADKIILTADSNYNAQTTSTNDDQYIFPGDDTSEEP